VVSICDKLGVVIGEESQRFYLVFDNISFWIYGYFIIGVTINISGNKRNDISIFISRS